MDERGRSRGQPSASARLPALSRRQFLYGASLAAALGAVRAGGPAPASLPDGGRVIASLNGPWDFQPASSTASYPPPATGWTTISVPSEWNMTAGDFATSWGAYDIFETPRAWDHVDAAWYRRTVTVPASRDGQRIVLHFEAVNFETVVYWNGAQVASNAGGLLPFEADVTAQVSFGQANTIELIVTAPGTAAATSSGFVYPCGSWWGQTCAGIWQDVWLLARPAVCIEDSILATSVRQQQLTAQTTVRNDTASPATTVVYQSVWDGPRRVFQTVTKVTLPAAGSAEVPFSAAWADPQLWGPQNPYLYDFQVDLRDSAGGPVSDSATTRFGFREVWIDGDVLYLNGVPTYLRGDEWHYMGSLENSRAYATLWFGMARAAGANYIRLHAMPYPPVFYDVADETGMLVVGESGIYGSSVNYDLSDPQFWQNAADHLAARVRRDRNHPSIVAWSAENEMLTAFGASWTSQVAALKPVVLAQDATRPVYFEGDNDPDGVADMISFHYPLEATTNTTIPDVMYTYTPGYAWRIENDALYISNGGIGVSADGDSWTDYTFSVGVTPLQTGGHGSYAQAGLAVRMNDSLSGYAFLLSNYPYTIPAASGYLVFISFAANVPVTLRPVVLPFAVTGGTSYQVVTTVSGSTLTVAINGALVDTVTDTTYTAGRVGFREAGDESAVFRDVVVTAPDGTVLLADDFTDGLSQWQPPDISWNRQKPLMISEFGAMFAGIPPDVSAIGGSEAYTGLDGMWSTNALATRAQLEGFRYAGVTGVAPWNTVWYGMKPLPFNGRPLPPAGPGQPQLKRVGEYAATLNPGFQPGLPAWEPNPIHDAIARAYSPIAALATDYRAHYWGASTLAKVLAVHNDTAGQATVTVSWSLRTGRGQAAGGQQTLTLPPTGQADVTASVPTPPAAAVTAATWEVTATSGGRPVFTHTAPIRLYPRTLLTSPVPGRPRAAVLEPGGPGPTSAALTSIGVQTRTITDLSQAPGPGELLVIAEGADYVASAAEHDAVVSFAKGGGAVLVLASGQLPGIFPWPLFTMPSPQTITHRRAPYHPVLAGIGPDDLRWWQTTGEQLVSTLVIKPRAGSLLALADGGQNLGGAALSELRYGRGTYLSCQYPLIAALRAEPVAAILLRNALEYLSGRRPAAPRRLGTWSRPGGRLPAVLRASLADARPLHSVDATALSEVDVLAVDASSGNQARLGELASAATALRSWLTAGGTLWLNGLEPATLGAVAAFLPADAQLTEVDARHRHGAVNLGAGPLGDGISNADLYWPVTGPPLVRYGFSSSDGTRLIETGSTAWSAYLKYPEQTRTAETIQTTAGFTPSGALWQQPAGAGQVIVDQLGWASSAAPMPLQTGLAATLAADLGAGFTTAGGSLVSLPPDGWSATTSPAGGSPGLAFDRVLATGWTSGRAQQPGMYFSLDLGTVATVTQVAWYTAPEPDDYPRGAQVQVSADTASWTTVAAVTDTSGCVTGGWLLLSFRPVAAQYVRVVNTGSSGYALSLYEIYVVAVPPGAS